MLKISFKYVNLKGRPRTGSPFYLRLTVYTMMTQLQFGNVADTAFLHQVWKGGHNNIGLETENVIEYTYDDYDTFKRVLIDLYRDAQLHVCFIADDKGKICGIKNILELIFERASEYLEGLEMVSARVVYSNIVYYATSK